MYIESNPPLPGRCGSIEVICGSMFSGKTEELIRRINRVRFTRQKIAIYKPSIDTRYSREDVVSHDSTAIASTPIETARLIPSYTDEDVQVVAIDEAQFFDNDLVDVCNNLANRGIRVIVAGLDMDYTGRPFGPIPALCAIADDVQKTRAICVRCGRLANFSYRTVSESGQVLLGEKDEYQPLCRCCYNELMKAKEQK